MHNCNDDDDDDDADNNNNNNNNKKGLRGWGKGVTLTDPKGI
jgi:hypothetical protein